MPTANRPAIKGLPKLPNEISDGHEGGFGLAVNIQVEDKSLSQAELERLVKEAHEKICPYSHATRGNVDVKFEVIGG